MARINGIGEILQEEILIGKLKPEEMPPIDRRSPEWSKKSADYQTAILVENGKYLPQRSQLSAISGGKILDTSASNIKISSNVDNLNGLYVKGSNSSYRLSNATIGLSGKGSNDFIGVGAAAMVDGGSTLILENVTISTNGVIRCATTATGKSILRVYNSVLVANGGILPADHVPVVGAGMDGPPVPLGITGNCRAHLTLNNSKSYFYDSIIVADGWGALSTDMSDGYVYLEANKCLIKTIRSGYGSYADWGCHNVFNICEINSAAMAGIMAGECDMTFNGTNSMCGTYFIMMHSVFGKISEVSTLKVTGGNIKSASDLILIKSDNAVIFIDNAKIVSENGVLIHSVINDDPCATKVNGAKVSGIKAMLKNMTLEGNIIHEDTERTMSVALVNTNLKGSIKNASISLDKASKWFATTDSTVQVAGSFDTRQIDAAAGVTVIATSRDDKTYKLPSGGILKTIS
jgi:hypothetical protein